jgi:hypothetical protein
VIEPTSISPFYNIADEKVTNLVSYIANNTAPIFYYYDKNYDGTNSALATPINIPLVRLIKINILIDKDTNKEPGVITATTQISLRNLKDNL